MIWLLQSSSLHRRPRRPLRQTRSAYHRRRPKTSPRRKRKRNEHHPQPDPPFPRRPLQHRPRRGGWERAMTTSQRGVDLIKPFEGLKLPAYLCPANVWTIGYGTTRGVQKGQTITAAEAERLLRADLAVFEAGVSKAVKVPLEQHEFDALVSFAYNVGLGAFQKSTLLRLLNAGDKAGAAKQFDRWNKAGGKVLAGLTRRREAERKLFEGKP